MKEASPLNIGTEIEAKTRARYPRLDRANSPTRRLFCQLAVGKMGYPGKRAEMATMVLETTL